MRKLDLNVPKQRVKATARTQRRSVFLIYKVGSVHEAFPPLPCSTGEELYFLSMTLCLLQEKSIDIYEHSVGIYWENIRESKGLTARFFPSSFPIWPFLAKEGWMWVLHNNPAVNRDRKVQRSFM